MKIININPKKIKNLYWQKGLSIREIAKKFGFSMGAIRKFMIKKSIPRRPPTKEGSQIITKKEDLIKLYFDNTTTVNEIARRFGVVYPTIYKWLKKYEISPKGKVIRYKKYPFLGDNREKSYLLGLCCGDFYVYKHCRQICVESTTTHPSMMQLFYNLFKKYGAPIQYPKYNKKTGRYEWRIYIHLDKSFSFLLSNPLEAIKRSDFYYFLAGFFDAEGCLHIYNNHNYIGLSMLIYNGNKGLLEAIKNKLNDEGFNLKFGLCFKKGQKTTDGYYRGCNIWAVRLYMTNDILKLLNKLPLKHKEKIDKAKIALSVSEKRKWVLYTKSVRSLQNKIKTETKNYVIQAEGDWRKRHVEI